MSDVEEIALTGKEAVLVRKEDISAVRIVWPEDKPGHLEKNRCVRGVEDPRDCEICHYFAGKRDASGKYTDFWQRWLGHAKRLVAYIDCGAPAAEKKALRKGEGEGVVGISPKNKGFEAEKKKQAMAKEKARVDALAKADETPDKTPEPSQPTEPTLSGAGPKPETVKKDAGEPVL